MTKISVSIFLISLSVLLLELTWGVRAVVLIGRCRHDMQLDRERHMLALYALYITILPSSHNTRVTKYFSPYLTYMVHLPSLYL